MPYLFPYSFLNNFDPLDSREFSQFILPAADKVQGRLNEHDFEQSCCQNETISAGAYYRHHLIEKVVDPDFLVSGTPKVGGNGPDASFVLVNDKQWHTVTGTSVTATTEASSIWVAAFVQYTYHEWTKSDAFQASVQFALRVDGEIMEEDITGKFEQADKAVSAFRVNTPKSDGSFVGARVFRQTNPHSLGAQHRPVRLGFSLDLAPGAHTIEVVAKRVAYPGRIAWLDSNDYIECHTRRLYALEVPLLPQGNPAGSAAVGASYMEDGTILSKAEYETARLDEVIAAYNDIEQGNCERGAFNHNHIPTAVFYAHQEVLGGTLHSLSSEYPGFSLATIGDPGWTQIFDGAGNLELPVQLNFPAYGDCYFILMADIEITKVWSSDGVPRWGFDNFGNLCFMSWYAGAWHVIGSGATECAFNAHYVFSTEAERDMNLCVSMLYVVKLTNPAQAFDKVGLFGSTWDGNGSNKDVTMGWRTASIKALVLRP